MQPIPPGSTMFDLLKKKKQQILQSSFAISRPHLKQQSEDNCSQQPTKRIAHRKSPIHSNLKQHLTPTKTYLADKGSNQQTRSFIQLISPQRTHLKSCEKNKKETHLLQNQQPLNTYSKQLLSNQIHFLRESIDNFMKIGKKIQEKWHPLFLDLKTVFRQVEQSNSSIIDGVSVQVKAFQSLVSSLRVEKTEKMLTQFFLQLSGHINHLEGAYAHQLNQHQNIFQKEVNQAHSEDKHHFHQQIKQMSLEIQSLNKKLCKSQESYAHDVTENSSKKDHLIHQLEEALKIYQFEKVEMKAKQLKYEEKEMEDEKKIRLLEKDVKEMEWKKEESEKSAIELVSLIKTEQEEYLLNEIMILKKEFAEDIQRMNELHQVKESQLMRQIQKSILQNQELNRQVQRSAFYQQELQTAHTSLKSHCHRLKQENECLVTDMHRINEELYQHWLALKDMKILATRLDILHKFNRIFDDLAFNEHLFR